MMCDDCIYSKDSICTYEAPILSDSWDCLSKIDKETYANIYNKALDDFVNVCKENILCQTFGLRGCDIEQIVEQLKGV